MSSKIDKKIGAWHTFLRAHSVVIRALERKMEEEQHLPLNWFDVLAWLSHAPDGRLRMQVLAKSIYLSNSGLTRLLNRMAAAGFIERQNCPDDRRGWYAVITAKGRKAFERAFPGNVREIEEHFIHRFNDDEIEVLNDLLSRLIKVPAKSKERLPANEQK
jgi:DNA-binding MarR family transcriptional regulator